MEELISPTVSSEVFEAKFGAQFPIVHGDLSEEGWGKWAEDLWNRHGMSVKPMLHLAERNRYYRRGVQWISSQGIGAPWREPAAPRDSVRAVDNIIGPALDLRLQILAEQRPGFRVEPVSSDPDDEKRAEGMQAAVEYQFKEQGMEDVMREAAYWAGTDGVSFIESYWDPDAGPWDELPGFGMTPLGDVRSRVRRIEQVRVSAEATSTVQPSYMVICEYIPLAVAVSQYGDSIRQHAKDARTPPSEEIQLGGLFKNGYELPSIHQLHRNQDTVARYTVYCKPCPELPMGLMVVSIGCYAVFVGELFPGVIPVVRFTDGSTDPAYFPQAAMNNWIDSQQRLNRVKSRWIEAVRINAGGKMVARENAIAAETLVAGGTTVITVRDPRPFDDLIKVLTLPELGRDAEQLYVTEKKTLEDLTGYNDVSRGQFSSETSGRAILAIREQLERTFAPTVFAAAKAMSQWAKVTLAWMKWGYEMPRSIQVVGEGRPDLARVISGDMMGGMTAQGNLTGVADVQVEPETMMPMPRSLRLFLLNDMMERGLMTPIEYRRRMPFAKVRSLRSPDDEQENRARRVAEAIRQTGDPMALELLWMDDEAIHQDILQSELILPDNIDPMIRQAAQQRWFMLANQAMMKAAGMNPMMMGGDPSLGGGGGGLLADPSQQPTMSMGSSPVAPTGEQVESSMMGVGTMEADEVRGARQFDQQSGLR